MRMIWISICFASVIAAAAATPEMPSRTPIVLELFTSEGCSSCPPADELLKTLDERQPYAGAQLIVLSEHVDYWNHLGWSDPFSSKTFSDRQNMYAGYLRLRDIYTPQLVIDGKWEALGSDQQAIRERVAQASAARKIALNLTNLTRSNGQVRFHLGSSVLPSSIGSANIYVVIADSRVASSVRRGENAGRDFVHVAVVRSITSEGTAKAGSAVLTDVAVPVSENIGANGLRVVALLQKKGTREIVAAGQEKL
jgi:hypothetical protein